MPHYVLSWWNVDRQHKTVCDRALQFFHAIPRRLSAGGGNNQIPAAHIASHALGEVQVFQQGAGFGQVAMAGLSENGSALATDYAAPHQSGWVAVRGRPSTNPRQLGYYGARPAAVSPERLDKGHAAPWVGADGTWSRLPASIDNAGGSPATLFRANATVSTTSGNAHSYTVRTYPARREIVEEVHAGGMFRVHWYHAISGGGNWVSTPVVYDLMDAIELLIARTAAPGVDRIGALFGDLNCDPQIMRNLVIDKLPSGIPFGGIVSATQTMTPGHIYIVATDARTHRGGSVIDYAVIYYHNGGANAGNARARIGILVAEEQGDTRIPIRDAAQNPVTDAGGQTVTSDHYPVRLWVHTP